MDPALVTTTLERLVAIQEAGGLKVYAAATHPILSGPAIERVNSSVLEKVIVTDSLVTDHDYCSKIEIVTISNLFGEAIKRIYDGESVSYLFDSKNITQKITNHH